MKHLLSIAGSDSSGGAGIQADLKTFSALGSYGMSALSAITAQNTLGVQSVMLVSPEMLIAQLNSIFDDIRIDAIKIGMLGTAELIRALAAWLRAHRVPPVVLDTVMVSKSGHALLDPEAVAVLAAELLPCADLITPNIPEAEALTGNRIESIHDMIAAGKVLLEKGARAVLVKGGHRSEDATDVLVFPGGQHEFTGRRIDSVHTHGTGCSLSSAIAVGLAEGKTLEEAIFVAKEYVSRGIQHGLNIGKGTGPIHHFHAWWPGEKPD